MTHLLSARHQSFVLYELLAAEELTRLPAFSAHDRATFDAAIETARRIAVDHFAPSYALLDHEEPGMENGRVIMPAATADALRQLAATGFFGAVQPEAKGGMGLPRTVANAALLWLQAANVSIANYAFLTMSAAELIALHGTPEQQARWLPPMLEGRFLGTMALSEPHAGSSLGDIRTSARPLGSDRYALKGTKMWISGGEHDMADNIVHMMLARIDGAPAGTRGISLFIVPRRRLDADGRPAEWNNIALAGLNHKMGQRGTVNTVLNVGEGGDTIGEIVGQPGEGLARMFTMMNEARILVSMGAVAHAGAGYQHSLAYARERLQGRHPAAKDPASPQVPLIEHADIRRLLLQQKAAAEGGVALGLHLARLADLKAAAVLAADRAEAGLLLEFLTPVFKAWISEECLRANDAAIQVLGGAGYTRDHPVEQHYRDNRLNPIHEGTNGIQAIDLLGRKVAMGGGRAFRLFLERLRATAAEVSAMEELADCGRDLAAASDLLERATRVLRGDRLDRPAERAVLANAAAYLDLTGLITFAWIWLEQARVSARALAAAPPGSEQDFYRGLVHTCRYIFRRRLPATRPIHDLLVECGDRSALDMRDAWF